MLILAIVIRVIALWILVSFALGLCWAAACLIAPRIARARRRLRAGRASRPVARPVGLPLDAKAGGTQNLAEAQAQPAGALPRRFAPHTRPAREALARTGTTPRSHTETAS